ncbi:MAG: tetratricopeptide repeat protein [Planctomycetota bacterium]|jgi:tetratricopeptide (TPR) repeat protein
MWPHIATVLVASLLSLWQPDQPGQDAPTAEEIGRAVEALGDESFEVREQASEFLWRAGKAAEPALKEALHGDDVEAAARAARILRQFQFGILPDTPSEVVTLIGQYRYGTEVAKLAVLKTLLGKGEAATLLKLLKAEPDEKFRKQLTDGLLKDLDKLAGALFIQGDWTKAEQLLQIGATSDDGMRNYAAYLLLRGQLEAKISELKDRTAGAPNAVDAKLLAYLLRAEGDLSGARSAAQKTSDTLLTAGILFELGDWKQLARLHQSSPEKTSATLPGGIVDLGYAAAYHRLAGNTEEIPQAVAAIKELAERKPNKLWYCGETLIINERYQDAVELLKQGRRTSAFEILRLQHRFREALRLAGTAEVRGPYSPWFPQVRPPTQIDPAERRERFSMGLRVASMLLRLDQKEDAVGLFAELARAAEEDNNLSLRSVCEAEYRVGLTEQAFEHAAVVLAGQWNTSVLHTLFPEHQEAARTWWKFFCQKYREEPRKVTLDRLRRLLGAALPVDPDGDDQQGPDWRRLVEEAERTSQELDDGDRGRWLTVLGETYLARGEPRTARSHLHTAAHLAPSASVFMRLGDLASAEAEWDHAARWYRLAWQTDRTKPAPLYLQGRALVRAGDESEGHKLIEAARLLPLGNAPTRCDFAQQLEARGLTDEAVRQWQCALRTGEFQSQAINQAAERLGHAIVGKDDLRAAALWRWPLMRCLRTSTSNLGIEGYLRRSHLIHKTRARGLIAAGRTDEALEEIRLSHAALPGEVALAVEMVPLLEEAGRPQEADRLFARVFAVHERVCRDFPKSTTHRHDLARLAVGCRRRLGEALKHANRAVALDPDNPAYIGTLAEIHFQRGDRQRAVELAKRCIRLAPKEEFRQQLERFLGP